MEKSVENWRMRGTCVVPRNYVLRLRNELECGFENF